MGSEAAFKSLAVAAAIFLFVGPVGCTENRPRATPIAPASDANQVDFDHSTGETTIALFGDQPEVDGALLSSLTSDGAVRHTQTADGNDFDPDVDASGDWLVFASTRNAEHPDIYLKRMEGAAATQLTSDPADDVQPRFSPDGGKIAFASNRTGNWDIWISDRQGNRLTQLTQDRADEIAPTWSPDGNSLAFTRWNRQTSAWEIWTLSTAQPAVRHMLTEGMFPAWSPDGDRIAFQRARQRATRCYSIWTAEIADNRAVHITEVVNSEWFACIAPTWSTDGRSIAFCAVERSRPARHGNRAAKPESDIRAIDLQTFVIKTLTSASGDAFNPLWHRSGRVFYVSDRTGAENIWSVAVIPRDAPNEAKTSDAKVANATVETVE